MKDPCEEEDILNQNNHLLFKFLIEQSNDAIFLIDPDSGQVLYCNDKACVNLGYDPIELRKKRVFDFAQNVKSHKEWLAHICRLETEESLLFETEQMRKDGTLLPVEVNVRLVQQPDRSYVVSIARDISKRKKTEALLISELSKIEAFMQALDDKITVQDKNLKIIYQNSAHQKMQGSHVGEFCYKAYNGFEDVCDGCLVVKSFEDGKIHKRETSTITAKGKIHIEVVSYPVKDNEGNIIAAAEVVRDITKHKEAEEVLRNTAQVRKQFISTAAHELGTPLSSILGYSELLLKADELGAFDAAQKNEFIDIIHKKACALTDIVDNLLDISRIDAGQPLQIERSFCDLKQIIEKTISSYRNLFKDHTIQAHFTDGLEHFWADEQKMVQVLENLLTNAVKYSPDGGRIELSVDKTDRDYLFTLTDEGIGMTDEQISRIFEPFYRAAADDPEISGQGLGMSIVKQIVEGHRGAIRVEHNVPKGLKVLFSLPLHKTE